MVQSGFVNFFGFRQFSSNPFPILLWRASDENRRSADDITRHPCIFSQTRRLWKTLTLVVSQRQKKCFKEVYSRATSGDTDGVTQKEEILQGGVHENNFGAPSVTHDRKM